MAAPLDYYNYMLDTYQHDDAEPIQEAIESTVHGVYNSSETEAQDQAISTMLDASGGNVDFLVALTRSFTAVQDAGHDHCLSAISSIPEVERLRRITAVAVNGLAFPTTVARGVSARENPKRGPRSGESCFPANKRARRTPKIYGCLGEGGKYLEYKFKLWRSRAGFVDHFVQEHVQEFKVGTSLQCLQCLCTESAYDKYPENGTLLPKHLSVQTKSETDMTPLALEDGEETTW